MRRRGKSSPTEFLRNLLDSAIQYNLLNASEAQKVLLCANIQENIDFWRKKVRVAMNYPDRHWVLAVPSVRVDTICFERIDEQVFDNYDEATRACRRAKSMSQVKLKCRVVEASLARTPLSSVGIGKSVDDLINILQADGLSLAADSTLQSGGYLCLRNKGITSQDIPAILSLCEGCDGAFTQIGLTQNALHSEGARRLSSSLQSADRCRYMTALFLGSNDLGDEGVFAIAELVETNCLRMLTKLSLNDNNITDLGARKIAQLLDEHECPCSQIEVLGLSKNLITATGASSLGLALKINTKMKRLFLNNNDGICDDGATALASAAHCHVNLKRLGLSDCGISDSGGLVLLDALKGNLNLERICVCGNMFSAEVENMMREESRFNFYPVKS